MSANVNLDATALRALADALDKLREMRWRQITPGNSYEEARISHGESTFRLTWVDVDGDQAHYAITEVEG